MHQRWHAAESGRGIQSMQAFAQRVGVLVCAEAGEIARQRCELAHQQSTQCSDDRRVAACGFKRLAIVERFFGASLHGVR